MNQMDNNNNNKDKNKNSSNSLVFGRWPQTKILDGQCLKTKLEISNALNPNAIDGLIEKGLHN